MTNRAAVPSTQIAIEKLQIQNLIKAKDDATERYDRLILDFSQLDTTNSAPQQPAVKTRKISSHPAVLQAPITFATSQPYQQHMPSAAEERSHRNSDMTDNNTVLLYLHTCSSAVSRLASTINAASLQLSMTQTFDVFSVSESYRGLQTAVETLLGQHLKHHLRSEDTGTTSPKNSARFPSPARDHKVKQHHADLEALSKPSFDSPSMTSMLPPLRTPPAVEASSALYGQTEHDSTETTLPEVGKPHVQGGRGGHRSLGAIRSSSHSQTLKETSGYRESSRRLSTRTNKQLQVAPKHSHTTPSTESFESTRISRPYGAAYNTAVTSAGTYPPTSAPQYTSAPYSYQPDCYTSHPSVAHTGLIGHPLEAQRQPTSSFIDINGRLSTASEEERQSFSDAFNASRGMVTMNSARADDGREERTVEEAQRHEKLEPKLLGDAFEDGPHDLDFINDDSEAVRLENFDFDNFLHEDTPSSFSTIKEDHVDDASRAGPKQSSVREHRSSQEVKPPQSTDGVKYTRTGRVSKATKGQRVHHCETCGKTYTRVEHLRQHQQNHVPGAFVCDVPGCEGSFYREDLLTRHKKRHSDPNNPSTLPVWPLQLTAASVSFDQFSSPPCSSSLARESLVRNDAESTNFEHPSTSNQYPNASSKPYRRTANALPTTESQDPGNSHASYPELNLSRIGEWSRASSSPSSPSSPYLSVYLSPTYASYHSHRAGPYFQSSLDGKPESPSTWHSNLNSPHIQPQTTERSQLLEEWYGAYDPVTTVTRSPVSAGSSVFPLQFRPDQGAQEFDLQYELKTDNVTLASNPLLSQPEVPISKKRKRQLSDEDNDCENTGQDGGVHESLYMEKQWHVDNVDDLVRRWTTVEA